MKLRDRSWKAFTFVPRCEKLLDIGCDTGVIANEYRRKAKEVHAVDSNKSAIANARKKYPKVNFSVSVAEKLKFKNNLFDVVTMTDVLEHVNDEKKSIAEMKRVLKKGGALVLSVPHKGFFHFIDSFNMKFYFPRFYRWWKGKNYNPEIYKIAPWHRHYSFCSLKKILGPDFKIMKVHTGGLFVFPILWVAEDMFQFLKKIGFLSSFLDYLRHFDYMINYGRSGFSIMLLARKIK